MSKTILHIGFPKTATTWFQQTFYPNIKNAYFLSRDFVFDNIAFQDIFSFNHQEIKNKIKQISGDKRVLICDEIFLGGLDIGFGNGEFFELMAKRLYLLFPDAEIVFFIRNQHAALESAYSHYIMSGGTYSAKRYLGIKRLYRKPFMGYHLFNPKVYEYDKVIGTYVTLYGVDKVHIYLFEEFEKDPSEFIKHYCEDLQIDLNEKISPNRLNKRLSSISLQKQRFLNRFTLGNTPYKQYFFNIPRLYNFSRSLTKYIDSFFSLPKFQFSKDIHNWIEKRFKDSNQNLSTWIDADRLKHWGYPF
ncbi:MAG: hypothetical protein PWR03_2070 [Tenuifilum sp.]|uniref:hypothetical protein n=1 Tax=Tenuifilum sp. TaxID=2760880 RepID=UPI0024AB4DD0|nr:hypothetical protein [Tenuifilum sp.]MDI3527886.1 hypothetical protein [Tenuifilum sp.]